MTFSDYMKADAVTATSKLPPPRDRGPDIILVSNTKELKELQALIEKLR